MQEEISLKSFGKSGDALIISSDFVGNAFDEYLIIEFYTPDLLNEKDSIICRSAVSDPKGYYIPDQALADLKVLYHGQEIDLKDCTFIKKEVSKNETKKNSERS